MNGHYIYALPVLHAVSDHAESRHGGACHAAPECWNTEKTENKKLHPIQFEELTARFYYSAYLFSRLPDYTYLETPKGIFVEAMPLDDFSGKPMFDKWTAKTYSQVLENFWKPWAINMFEIRKNPEKPISFLLNESGDLVESNKVVCPDEE